MAIEVVVTGGGGALGASLVSMLRAEGHDVLSCGRAVRAGVDVAWDLTHREERGPDFCAEVVVHAAAQVGSYGPSPSDAAELFDTNVSGTLRVAKWCLASGVRKLVLVSGAIVYGAWNGAPKSEDDDVAPWKAGPYAASKWGGEYALGGLRELGCALAVIRLSSLYGPAYRRGLIQQLVRMGLTTGEIRLRPPLDDAFDLLHVEDAARTVGRAVIEAEMGIWNVGGGTLVTVHELASLCARYTNARLVIEDREGPVRPARILNWVDDRRARSELGHKQQVSLAAGIESITRALQEST